MNNSGNTHTGMIIMGVLFALLTGLCFGLTNVYSRKASKKIAGLDAVALTIGLNALLFVPICFLIKYFQGTPWPNISTTLLYFSTGVFSVFLGRWGLYNAIALIGPSRASLIKNSSPVFTVLLAYIFFREWPSLVPFIGIVFIFSGLFLLSMKRDEASALIDQKQPMITYRERVAATLQNDPAHETTKPKVFLTTWTKGVILCLLVSLSFAIADVIRALSMQIEVDVITATGFSIMGAFITLLMVLAVQGKLITVYSEHWKSLNRDLILASVFAGLAQAFTFVAVTYLFVPYVSALVATAPVFTAICSWLLSKGDEKFSVFFWVSTVLFLVGCTLIILFA